MIDINNVFVCIAAPLLAASFCLGKKYFHPVFFMLTGMGVCLLSAYINTFIAALYQTTAFHAATEIAPVIEEVMNLLPLLFYLLIFEPEPEHIKPSILSIAVGFATFENICYLVQNGTTNFGFLLIRGFGTGAMHILCGAVIGYGLIYVWRRTWLKLAGTFGLLGYVSFSTESIICSSPTAAGYNTSPIFCPWSSSYWAFRPEKCYFPICIQANTDFLLGCREAALFL